MRCLVIGAGGYVGSRLVPALLREGHRVRCLVRDPGRLVVAPFRDQVEVVTGDVVAGTGLAAACADIDVVYYLVHSLSRRDFDQADRVAAEFTARAAAEAGVTRIVYLGGLRPGPGPGSGHDAVVSRHLASRAEVGEIFLRAEVPAVVLQASVIIGSGSVSFEMVRYLCERLPIMVTPKWVVRDTQPIAISDVLRYLVGCAALPAQVNRTFDIGGPDVLSYLDMMQRYARIAGLPRRITVPAPFLVPWLSSWWVELVTPVPRALAEPLIASLVHELTCGEHDIAGYVPDPPHGLLDYEQSVRRALAASRTARTRPTGPPTGGADEPAAAGPTDLPGAGGPVFTEQRTLASTADPDELWRLIESIGGTRGWYTPPLVWEVRGWIDQLLGGVGAHRGRRDPRYLRAGEVLDWWRVEEVDRARRRLLLRAEMRMPGTAWLECVVGTGAGPDSATEYRQTLTFVPSGLAGHLYWWLQLPLHNAVFAVMARGIVRAAEARSGRQPALLPTSLRSLLGGFLRPGSGK